MNYLILILRLIHILSGIFWVGSALMMTFFIGPTASATAQAGQQFMQHFITKTNIQRMMIASAFSTVIAGALLYADKPSAWFASSAGKGFGIGAVFAVIGLVFGILIGRLTNSIIQLGGQIKGQPTAEQLAQLQLLQNRQRLFSTINAYSLILAVAFMATARYFTF